MMLQNETMEQNDINEVVQKARFLKEVQKLILAM